MSCRYRACRKIKTDPLRVLVQSNFFLDVHTLLTIFVHTWFSVNVNFWGNEPVCWPKLSFAQSQDVSDIASSTGSYSVQSKECKNEYFKRTK